MAVPSRRPLGSSTLRVAPLALGGNVFGWTVDESRGFAILDEFVEAGFNLIDTADVYSRWVSGHTGGESESMIGRWLRERGRRKDVLIATKVGMDSGPAGRGLSPGHIRRSIAGSLNRLGTDYVDLYQTHEDDPGTPLEETLEALDELVRSGAVRAIGASNYSPARLEQALRTSADHGLHRFESLQPRYNLMDREPYESTLDPVCRTHGLGVLTYSSLASGFLTGKYRTSADLTKSVRGARAEARLTDVGHRILRALDEIADETATAPATVALAWLMGRPGVTAPIASATNLDQLRQLLGAASLRLSSDAALRLDEASAPRPPG